MAISQEHESKITFLKKIKMVYQMSGSCGGIWDMSFAFYFYFYFLKEEEEEGGELSGY